MDQQDNQKTLQVSFSITFLNVHIKGKELAFFA